MAKFDFQKEFKIPYLECAVYKTLIRLRKQPLFVVTYAEKMAVAETFPSSKRTTKFRRIINQKITQKLIEKVSMTAITETLSVSTSTVIRKLKEFEFRLSDLNHLPEHMSWDEYSFKKGKMSFIAHDYDTRKIVSILDGRN